MTAVLRCLGLSEDDRKVFLSYRRERESSLVAESLWRRLSERGFDVFLDRYRVQPGEDFRSRLDRELVDKAFVVIIESEGVVKSRWVQHEVCHALTHHIGLLAVSLPHLLPRQRLRVVPDAFRHKLTAEDLQPDGLLREEALDRLLQVVTDEHERMLVRRRAQLLLSAQDLLHDAGWDPLEVADWSLIAQHPVRNVSEVLRVTPRSPRPVDLYRLDTLRAELVQRGVIPAGTRARLVHAVPDADPELADLMRWLTNGRLLETTQLADLDRVLAGADRERAS